MILSDSKICTTAQVKRIFGKWVIENVNENMYINGNKRVINELARAGSLDAFVGQEFSVIFENQEARWNSK